MYLAAIMKKPILSKLKEHSSIEVLKYLNGIKRKI